MGQRLDNFYKTNNFKINNALYYGVYRNRVISVLVGDRQYIATISFNGQLNRELGMALNNKIREIKEHNRILLNGLTTNVFLELRFYYSNNVDEEMLRVIDLAIDAMDDLRLPTCEVCPICQRTIPSNAPFVRIKNQALQAHEECIEQLVGQFDSMGKSLMSNDKNSIIKMVLISVLSLVTVTAITALIATLGGFSYFAALSGWICFIIMNISSIKLRVKANKTRAIMMIVFSTLTLFLSLYLGSIVDITRQAQSATIGEVFVNYFKILVNNFDEYTRSLILDLVLGLLFVGGSIFGLFKQLSSMNQKPQKL